SRRADVRSRLLARPARAKRGRVSRALGLPLVAVAAALAFFLVRPEPPLSYTVGADARPGVAGPVVAQAAPLTLRFSDGSAVRLAPGSRGRMPELAAHGAHVSLDEGSASLEVVHREATDWTVHAGPFLVQVVGTAFDVAWDDDGAVFELAVREGSVWAEGPR